MKLIVEMCKLFFKMTITEEQARQIYGLHSFRVGLVVALMKLGASDNTIQVTGRWASKAFEVYRRPDAAVSMIVSAAVASTENSSHSVAARAAGIPSLSRTSNENMLALQQVGQQTTQSEPIIAVGPNMSIVLPRLEEVEARKKAKDEVAEEEWQNMMDSVSTQELAVSQDRTITKENWGIVIPEGRRLRKKFKSKKSKGTSRSRWFQGSIRKVTIDEENPHEFPIEAKFDDGDEQNWSFDQFNEEMEKGTLQLMD